MGSDDTCRQCGHPTGPHVLAVTILCGSGENEIPAGGHMYCPVEGCECHSTWSIPDEVAGFDVRQRLAEEPPPDREAARRFRGH